MDHIFSSKSIKILLIRLVPNFLGGKISLFNWPLPRSIIFIWISYLYIFWIWVWGKRCFTNMLSTI